MGRVTTPTASIAARPSRPPRRRRWLIGTGIVLALIVILVLVFDWNWLRGPV